MHKGIEPPGTWILFAKTSRGVKKRPRVYHRNLYRRFDPSRGGQRSFECPGCPGGELYRGADLGGVFFVF